MFFKTKPLEQRAEEERNKVMMKRAQLEGKRLEREIVAERRKRIEEAHIPPRLRA
jgi:hypothetical protein